MVNLYLGGAPYYDLDAATYGGEDIRYYRDLADTISSGRGPVRVLELACGTGRVSLPLARAGFSVTGIDLSFAMLRIFEEKLQKEPEEVVDRITLYHADMADFDLPEAPFDLIIIPFRGFQALVETREAMNCLNRVKRHLDVEGVFVVDLFAVAPFNRWLDDFQERLDWKRIDPVTGNEVTRARIAGRCDVAGQVIHPTTVYYVRYPDGRQERIEDQFSLRYYFQHQMEALLLASGFEITEEQGDYRGAPIGEGAEQLFVCRHLPRPKLLG